MPLIIIDGPEKSGKSTLARLIRSLAPDAQYRHWGPVAGHEEYALPLLADVESKDLVVWDRSWASESVYSRLLYRGRQLGNDPWWGEWLYGRAVAPVGIQIMLLGTSPEELIRRRELEDLDVSPYLERESFRQYGERFGWRVYDQVDREVAADIITVACVRAEASGAQKPPIWAGPPKAPVVFVGEARNLNSPNWWMPFGSDMTAAYGRVLLERAMECGWTNTDADPTWLAGRRLIIACGQVAQSWCRQNNLTYESAPHPSWLMRWGKAVGQRQPVLDAVKRTVMEVLNGANVC